MYAKPEQFISNGQTKQNKQDKEVDDTPIYTDQ